VFATAIVLVTQACALSSPRHDVMEHLIPTEPED